MTDNNSRFTVTSRPSDIDPAERRQRLAQVYALLLTKAAERRARLAQGGGGQPAQGSAA